MAGLDHNTESSQATETQKERSFLPCFCSSSSCNCLPLLQAHSHPSSLPHLLLLLLPNHLASSLLFLPPFHPSSPSTILNPCDVCSRSLSPTLSPTSTALQPDPLIRRPKQTCRRTVSRSSCARLRVPASLDLFTFSSLGCPILTREQQTGLRTNSDTTLLSRHVARCPRPLLVQGQAQSAARHRSSVNRCQLRQGNRIFASSELSTLAVNFLPLSFFPFFCLLLIVSCRLVGRISPTKLQPAALI